MKPLGGFPEPRDNEHVSKGLPVRRKAKEKKEGENGNASGVGITEPELGFSPVA